MNKDFSRQKILSFNESKQIKILFDLALFIEKNHCKIDSNHFVKLKKYHYFLKESKYSKVQKLNKEFDKIKDIGHQFQIYLMNLERLSGQSSDEYNFIISTDDTNLSIKRKFHIICLLDSVRSAHNVGAMLRNAECFGVEKVILTGFSPDPNNQAVKKTAMGCDQQVSWEYIKDPLIAIKKFRELGYKIWSVETTNNGFDINEQKVLNEKIVLIFGHEQFGVSKELLNASDKTVHITLFGNKNSLNVSVCQGVILNQITYLLNHCNEA